MKQMQAYEALVAVRELPQEMQQAERELALIGDTLPFMPPPLTQILKKQTADVRTKLTVMRARYRQAMSVCMHELMRLPAVGRSVLWRFYVLRQTNNEISIALHMERRSIQRIKRDAINQIGGNLDEHEAASN